MNGETPSVPITTLAGIASLTDCKYKMHYLNTFFETIYWFWFWYHIIIISSYICVFMRQDNSAALFSPAPSTISTLNVNRTGTAFWAGSCTSELQLKVNCRLKVNCKNFLQKKITIHFTCSESCTLSKLNCSHQKSFVTHVFVAYNSFILSYNWLLMATIEFTHSTCFTTST